MTSPKEKREEAGLIVIKGRMITAEQFFARGEGRRGTRMELDRALAAGRDALEAKLTFIARAYVEEAMAIVRHARDDDPLGIKPIEPRVTKACDRLKDFGGTARTQAELSMPFRKQIERMWTICAAKGWTPRQRGLAKLLAKEMGVSDREIRRYLRAYRTRRPREVQG